MAEPRIQVELTASFIDRLESIETFVAEADAPQAYDKLLDGLRRTVIQNLRRFPRIGGHCLDKPQQSAEATAQLAAFALGDADALRESLHDYLIYMLAGSAAYLLSIRHHRQLSFAFAKLWEQ